MNHQELTQHFIHDFMDEQHLN